MFAAIVILSEGAGASKVTSVIAAAFFLLKT
jgi:hypothetical protein